MLKSFTALIVALAGMIGCETDRAHDDDDYMGRTDGAAAPATIPAPSSPSGASTNITEMDRTFVQEAAAGNLFEIQSAQLAIDRNPDPQLKQLASMIVQDHTRANNELKLIASSKGIEFPQRLAPKHQRMIGQLHDLHSVEFARQFQNMQEQAHGDAITLFDRQSREGSDPELKSFAQRTLPALRKHMDHMQQYRVPESTPPVIP